MNCERQDDTENQNNIEDLLHAIPHMSKTIVDDTLYEKVLTILVIFLDSDSSHCQLLDQWHGLDIILEACQKLDQDYRVLSLCMRLLGKWISKGNDALFDKLNEQYAFLLTMMVSGLRTSEPALRCASLEACQGLIHAPKGVIWLLQNEDAKSLIALSLMDESIYVVTQGCKFYLFLMEQEIKSDIYKQLCQHMDPSIQIKHFLEQQNHPSLLMAALEFCWTFANSTCTSVYHYLARTHLLVALPNLIQLNNRIIRKRVVEILSTLFQHSPSPIQLLTTNEINRQPPDGDDRNHSMDQVGPHQQCLKEAYTFIKSVYTKMMTDNATSIDDVCFGIETLQTSLELIDRLKQSQPTTQTMEFVMDSIQSSTDMLMELLDIGAVKMTKDEHWTKKVVELIQKSNRPIFLQRKLLQVVLQALHLLVEKFPLQVKNAAILEAGLQILSTPSFANDQRLLKTCLQLVITSLHCQSSIVSSADLQCALEKFMVLLIDKMDDSCLSSQNLVLVLSTIDELLGHDSFVTHLLGQDTMQSLMNAFRMKFVDFEWDVRDAMIEFVGGLFELDSKGIDTGRKNKIDFALSLGIPLLVLDRIKDQEPYIRASALKTVQKMMQTAEGWQYIQQHEQLRIFSRTLPRLLYDTEAFVRRATLDAMCCLVAHRSCEGLLLTQPDKVGLDHKDTLSADTLSMLMNDDDIEIRIRLCRLLDHMWQLKMQEKDQIKRHTSTLLTQDNRCLTLSYFYFLHGDHWLLECVNDSQRMVRLEAVQVIERIMATFETVTSSTIGNKRSRLDDDDDEKDTRFIKQLENLDLVHIKRTTNPEDLYQEAFDINPTMMTQLTDPTDDAHLPDCY